MKTLLAAFAGLGLSPLPTSASADEPAKPMFSPALPGSKTVSFDEQAARAVKVQLSAETTALEPGKPATIGLSFEIAKGWHLYWRNSGDSGQPISWTFETPEGVAVGEPQWPTPIRHVGAGDILDYIYENRVTLLFPVVVSPSLNPSSGTVTIKAHAEWLVCSEGCVPGERSVELVIPIADTSKPSAQAAWFAESRARIPVLASESGEAPIRASLIDDELVVRCDGAEQLTFFPYEGDPQPENALDQGAVQGAELRVAYAKGSAGERLRAVVEAKRGGRSTFHLIDISPATGDKPAR